MISPLAPGILQEKLLYKLIVDLSHMSSGTKSNKVIIFVHGLSGSSEGTWGKMIELFRCDPAFREYALDSYEYPTCKVNWAFWKTMPGIPELSDGLSTFIQAFHSDKTSIVLIGHSLGGLVLRHYIANLFKKSMAGTISAAIMIATPHTGAALGKFGNSLSFRHTHLRQLSKGSDILLANLADWNNLRIEEKIETLYVTGGMDSIVEGSSSKPFHGDERAKNLIKYGHIDVIKPEHAGDIRFVTVKKFIEALDATKKIKNGELRYIGSPLFYRYELESERFYLPRQLDGEVSVSLESSNIWLSGPSGSGKSAALTRAILKEGWHLLYFTLDGFSEMSADRLLKEICSLLLDRMGVDDSRLSEDSALPEILRSFEHALSKVIEKTKVAIFIEEIPITDEAQYYRFIGFIYHLSTLQDSIRDSFRLAWIFSSIINPEKYLKNQNIKLRERFDFIRMDYWERSEMEGLLKIICSALGVKFSNDEKVIILDGVSGSPRRLKMFIKACQTESGKKRTFTELLSEITMDAP